VGGGRKPYDAGGYVEVLHRYGHVLTAKHAGERGFFGKRVRKKGK